MCGQISSNVRTIYISYHIILTRLFNDDPPAIGIDKAKDKECGENEDGKVLVALSDAKVSLLDH